MQNRNKTAVITSLVAILIGLGLIGYGIYYYTTPRSPFLQISSADKSGSVSAKDAAQLFTALSSSRPWDTTLAEAAKKAGQQADSEDGTRMTIAASFVIGGIVLGVFGGLRIAWIKKRNSLLSHSVT